MGELDYYFFQMLSMGKALHEMLGEKAFSMFGGMLLNGDDIYALAQETIWLAFRETRGHYNEDIELDTWILMDPLVDRFCWLCRRYEQEKQISEEDDPYCRELAEAVRCAFSFNSYSYGYDWKLSAQDRGRKRLLFFAGAEFYDLPGMALGALELREFFQDANRRLEAELGLNKLVPIYFREDKEAA